MKLKKVLPLLLIATMSLSITACGNNSKDINIKKDTNIQTEAENNSTDTIDVDTNINEDKEIISLSEDKATNKDLLYYHVISIETDLFLQNLQLAGTAIDNHDEDDFVYYVEKMQSIIEYLEKMSVTEQLDSGHNSLIKALKDYKDAAVILNDSYNNINYEKYIKYDELAQTAVKELQSAIQVSSELENYKKLLSAFMETNYYCMNDYKSYFLNSKFSDEDNEALFVISHVLLNAPIYSNDTILSLYENNTADEGLMNLYLDISKLKEVKTENANLQALRDELIDGLDNFYSYLETYVDLYKNGNISDLFSKSKDISKNAVKIYDAKQFMKQFYEEYGMSIDYSPSSNIITLDTSLEYDVDENGNTELKKQETEISNKDNLSQEVLEIIGADNSTEENNN